MKRCDPAEFVIRKGTRTKTRPYIKCFILIYSSVAINNNMARCSLLIAFYRLWKKAKKLQLTLNKTKQ